MSDRIDHYQVQQGRTVDNISLRVLAVSGLFATQAQHLFANGSADGVGGLPVGAVFALVLAGFLPHLDRGRPGVGEYLVRTVVWMWLTYLSVLLAALCLTALGALDGVDGVGEVGFLTSTFLLQAWYPASDKMALIASNTWILSSVLWAGFILLPLIVALRRRFLDPTLRTRWFLVAGACLFGPLIGLMHPPLILAAAPFVLTGVLLRELRSAGARLWPSFPSRSAAAALFGVGWVSAGTSHAASQLLMAFGSALLILNGYHQPLRAPRHRVRVQLSTWSYSFLLVSPVVLLIGVHAIGAAPERANTQLVLGGVLYTLSWVLAGWIHRLVELPARKWGAHIVEVMRRAGSRLTPEDAKTQ